MSAILVTGVPGAGKTTIAKKLAKEISFLYINVNELVDECNAVLEVEEDACGKPVKVVDMDKLEKCFVEKYGGKEVVLEGVVVDFVPPQFVKKIIVLRVDPLIILERLLRRGYCIEKACENAEAELIGSYLPYLIDRYDGKVHEVICDTNCLDKIRAILKGEILHESVDWFDRAEELLSKCILTQTGAEVREMKN